MVPIRATCQRAATTANDRRTGCGDHTARLPDRDSGSAALGGGFGALGHPAGRRRQTGGVGTSRLRLGTMALTEDASAHADIVLMIGAAGVRGLRR